MKSKIIKNNLGISLLEVIVAMTIITIGLVGVLSLVIQNVEAQYIDKNILMASGLAQEGLELVRNVRDTNWLAPGNAWKQGLTGDGTYTIDYGGPTSIKMSVNSIADADARLYSNKICIGGGDEGSDCEQNSDCSSNVCQPSGFYTHTSSGNEPTNFYRLITIVDNNDYLDVKCAIRWIDGGQNHDYTAETYLYNWR